MRSILLVLERIYIHVNSKLKVDKNITIFYRVNNRSQEKKGWPDTALRLSGVT
jgi:hypothetical protein